MGVVWWRRPRSVSVGGAFSLRGRAESEQHISKKIYEWALIAIVAVMFTMTGLWAIELLTPQ